MEAPEKIYLQSLENDEIYNHWYRSKLNNSFTEYTRTDVIVEKAIGWIDDNNRNGGCFFEGWENDFKKYMKGEKA